jgi:hypothetical protein
MVQEISHRPLIAEDQVRAPVSPCGFVVDRVALGQVFLRVLRLPLVTIILPWPSILIYHLGVEQ